MPILIICFIREGGIDILIHLGVLENDSTLLFGKSMKQSQEFTNLVDLIKHVIYCLGNLINIEIGEFPLLDEVGKAL